MIDGKAQYGVGSSSLLLARLAGKPLVVLGVIFQHSPYVLLLPRRDGGCRHRATCVGKRVMIGSLTDELTQADELVAYLKKEGIPCRSLVRVEHSFDPHDLVNGKVEAMSAYVTNEPDYLDRIGFPTTCTARARPASIFTATTCSPASSEIAGPSGARARPSAPPA